MNDKDIEKAVIAALNKWIQPFVTGMIFGVVAVVVYYTVKYVV